MELTIEDGQNAAGKVAPDSTQRAEHHQKQNQTEARGDGVRPRSRQLYLNRQKALPPSRCNAPAG